MDFVFQRSYRGPLKAILLDWAGTTMDYGCYAPAVVFQAVYERQGVPITVEEARIPMGAHKKVHIRQLSQLDSIRERWYESHGRYPNETDVETMFAEFVPRQVEVLADYA
ncbi:MAG: phosphonoacetaldehyde hydrolase, partial [Chloroflexi bacterium]|nr:phosphonoacetaldehyde hydrolase [Chloroflexota bacterium]